MKVIENHSHKFVGSAFSGRVFKHLWYGIQLEVPCRYAFEPLRHEFLFFERVTKLGNYLEVHFIANAACLLGKWHLDVLFRRLHKHQLYFEEELHTTAVLGDLNFSSEMNHVLKIDLKL